MSAFFAKLTTTLAVILSLLELTLAFTEDPSCDCGQQSLVKPYIINGKRDDPLHNPWLATLYMRPYAYLCGGSVITRKHILTAGHCIHRREPADHYIVVGLQVQAWNSGRRHMIENWILHENYRTATQLEADGKARNDIAIIVVKKPIVFDSKVWPICLNDNEPNFYDTSVIVAGWGLTNCSGTIPTKNLLMGLMKLSPPDQCEAAMGPIYDRQTVMCLIDSDVVPYRGDSGSPLIVDTRSGYFLQLGIVSFSIGCSGEDSGVFFTSVSAYTDWIHQHTQGAESCKVPV